MTIKLVNGDEVKVGGKTYRVVNDELFILLPGEPPEIHESQLDRIERRLDELEKDSIKISYPPYVPYIPWYDPGATTIPPYPSTTWITCNNDIIQEPCTKTDSLLT